MNGLFPKFPVTTEAIIGDGDRQLGRGLGSARTYNLPISEFSKFSAPTIAFLAF